MTASGEMDKTSASVSAFETVAGEVLVAVAILVQCSFPLRARCVNGSSQRRVHRSTARLESKSECRPTRSLPSRCSRGSRHTCSKGTKVANRGKKTDGRERGEWKMAKTGAAHSDGTFSSHWTSQSRPSRAEPQRTAKGIEFVSRDPDHEGRALSPWASCRGHSKGG
jgi:hypothetical protein